MALDRVCLTGLALVLGAGCSTRQPAAEPAPAPAPRALAPAPAVATAVPSAPAPATAEAEANEPPGESGTYVVSPPHTGPGDPPFDKGAAILALKSVSLEPCKIGKAHGHVAITFVPDGTVSMVTLDDGPLVGTPAGSCVAGKYRAVRVPPFGGGSVHVGKSF